MEYLQNVRLGLGLGLGFAKASQGPSQTGHTAEARRLNHSEDVSPRFPRVFSAKGLGSIGNYTPHHHRSATASYSLTRWKSPPPEACQHVQSSISMGNSCHGQRTPRLCPTPPCFGGCLTKTLLCPFCCSLFTEERPLGEPPAAILELKAAVRQAPVTVANRQPPPLNVVFCYLGCPQRQFGLLTNWAYGHRGFVFPLLPAVSNLHIFLIRLTLTVVVGSPAGTRSALLEATLRPASDCRALHMSVVWRPLSRFSGTWDGPGITTQWTGCGRGRTITATLWHSTGRRIGPTVTLFTRISVRATITAQSMDGRQTWAEEVHRPTFSCHRYWRLRCSWDTGWKCSLRGNVRVSSVVRGRDVVGRLTTIGGAPPPPPSQTSLW